MQKNNDAQGIKKTHRQTQTSTTLNRKYVKKPAVSRAMPNVVKKSPLVKRFAGQNIQSDFVTNKRIQKPSAKDTIAPAQKHPLQQSANAKMRKRSDALLIKKQQPEITARQLKEQAIKTALADASVNSQNMKDAKNEDSSTLKHSRNFGIGRVVLALTCAAVAVVALVNFVNYYMPNIFASIQTDIEEPYPSYVPRGFTLSGVITEKDKISLEYVDDASGSKFSLVEEKSSWDSNALLNNYVKKEYGEDYSTIREQGITIYVDGSSATWVNGGIAYKIKAPDGLLTKKQIIAIATSL